MEIPPEIELHINKAHNTERDRNKTLFSSKWVERAFTWALYTIGAIVVVGIFLSAVSFYK